MSTLTVGTISEKVADAGVAVDGVTLKDGGVGTTSSAVALHASSLNGGQFGGRRNIIINGAMQVAQRGTSGSVLGSVTYGVDRFYGLKQTGTLGWSQETESPANFKNSLKFTNSAVGSGFCQFVQRIEGQNMAHLNFGSSDAQTITLSFYVRSSITGDYSIAFRNSSTNRSYVTEYTINTADTWQRITITFVGDTSGTWATDNTEGMNIVWGLGNSSGTSNLNQWTATSDFFATGSTNWFTTSGATWYITGVQLEVGQATPFEHLSFGETLNMCQRYYYRRTFPSTYLNFAIAYGTTDIQGKAFHPVQMRASPTLSFDGVLKASQGNAEIYSSSGFSFTSDSTNDSLGFYTSGGAFSGLTQFRGYMISTDTNDYMEVKSEL